MRDGDVAVIGSANIDLVLPVRTIPAPGETVLASSIFRGVGGKGLNQAIAAARAGARTTFVGAVGDDEAATLLTDELEHAGIDTSGLVRIPGSSGIAIVIVQDDGENSIVVAPEANAQLTSLTSDQLVGIERASVLTAQLEIPVSTVTAAAQAAHTGGARFILNAAPAQSLPPELLAAVDLLVVNQGEAGAIVGSGSTSDVVGDLLNPLLEVVPAAVITLGPEGSIYAERGRPMHRIPAAVVDAADTTGAGDTFTGGLAACVARGEPVLNALRFASTAAAITVTRRGAVSAIPHRAEVERFLSSTGPVDVARETS